MASKAAAAAHQTKRLHMSLNKLASKGDQLHFMINAAAFATDSIFDELLNGSSVEFDADFADELTSAFLANGVSSPGPSPPERA